MTIIDYLLIGGVAVAAVYAVFRLFLGWRNFAFPQDESETSGDLKVPAEAQPTRRVATGAPWKRRAEASDRTHATFKRKTKIPNK